MLQAWQRSIGQFMGRQAGEQLVIDFDDYFPAFLTFIANKWSRSASRLFLERFGVGIEAWRIMSLLAVEGSISATRIVNVIFMDKASVSRNFKALLADGLITLKEDPADARQRFATLTERGFAVHDQIIVIALEREKRLLACLDAKERRTLVSLLARVHANLAVLDADEDKPNL